MVTIIHHMVTIIHHMVTIIHHMVTIIHHMVTITLPQLQLPNNDEIRQSGVRKSYYSHHNMSVL